MKQCPQCRRMSLKVIHSEACLVGKELHIDREYQCVHEGCSYFFISTEVVKNGEPRKIPEYLKKKRMVFEGIE